LNWNVYKVFKNGKRAKLPVTNFEYEGNANKALQYFKANIIENFSEKNRGLEYIILNENDSQEREEKKIEESLLLQASVLNGLAKNLNLKKRRRLVGGLIFASATHWKWQWCALEPASNNFIAGLSPRFDNPNEAEKWMTRQIQNLK